MAHTLTIDLNNLLSVEEISLTASTLRALADKLDPIVAAKTPSLDERIEKEIKKGKKKTAVKVEEDEETFGEDEEEAETDLEEETEDAEETEEETDDEDWDLSADIIPAFTAYVKRNGKAGRSQAAKILKKFGAKSVQSLDEKHYDKVMKLIA